MDPLLIITYNGFFAYIHTICIGMPVCFVSFFSRVFSSCFDIATFVRFLLCNSNKILVIQEIFRWYYKHLIYSLDTISHNCVVRTPHTYKWFSYTQRASYMFMFKIVLKPTVVVLNLAKVYERVTLPVSLHVFVMRAAVEILSHQCEGLF